MKNNLFDKIIDITKFNNNEVKNQTILCPSNVGQYFNLSESKK